jgi:hypothetical protein
MGEKEMDRLKEQVLEMTEKLEKFVGEEKNREL